MNIIIDTHIFLWALSSPDKINPEKRKQIESATNTIYVSSISIVELIIKSSIGKLPLDFDPVSAAEESGFEILDYSGNDAMALKNIPLHHKDPFDRMLIAQSKSRSYPIMTEDSKFSLYDCELI